MKRTRPIDNARRVRLGKKRHSRQVKHRHGDAVQTEPPQLGWLSIRAPRFLSFQQSHNDVTVLFLRKIYVKAVEQGVRCTIDLSSLRDISLGAALALVAEINRAEELRPGNIIRGRLPKSAKLKRRLADVGFVAATTPLMGQSATTETGLLLKMRTGTAEDVQDIGFLDEFLRGIFPESIMSDQIRGRLKGAIKEALLNVVDHAYDPAIPREDACETYRWWICGEADGHKGCYFVVYDLGVGIPLTVSSTQLPDLRDAYERMPALDQKADFQLIKIAVTHPSSRTGLQGRGRGLPEMRRLIDRVGDGMLWITSGSGHYVYARGAELIDGGFPMKHRLHGTLVVWQLKVTAALSDGGHNDEER